MRVVHEYERKGALAYLAAWDIHRAKLFGRCEPNTGIVPFGNLVRQVMTQEPYVSARRGLLDPRQRLLPSRRCLGQSPRSRVAQSPGDPSARPRELAEPDRDLLLDR